MKSKDNFFVKFVYFYYANIRRLCKVANDIYDTVCDFFSELPDFFLNVLIVIVRFLSCILPIRQIYEACIVKWVSKADIKRLTGANYKGDYFRKKEVKQFEKEYASREAKP